MKPWGQPPDKNDQFPRSTSSSWTWNFCSCWHCKGDLVSAFCMFLETPSAFIGVQDHISLPRVIVKAPQHPLPIWVLDLLSVLSSHGTGSFSSSAKWSPAQPLGPLPCIYGYQITMQLCWPFKDLQYCLWWEQKPLLIAQTHRRSPHIPNKHASSLLFHVSLQLHFLVILTRRYFPIDF